MTSRAAFAARIAVVAVGLAACTGTDRYNPGERLGTYSVTGKLKSTSCAPSPDPWTFEVKLNRDGDTLHWVQGSVPVSGTLKASKVELTTSAVHELRAPDPKRKIPGCWIVRQDTLSMTVTEDPAKAGAVSSFAGGLTYTFTPTAESDCTDQLATSGGDMQALPCTTAYDLAGARTSTR